MHTKTKCVISFYLHNWDVINFEIYLQSFSKKWPRGGEGGGGGLGGDDGKYKNLNISRTKRTL